MGISILEMKTLVTGGAGFIGANIVKELQIKFRDAEITVLDDLSSGNLENLQGFRGEVIKGTIEDEGSINGLKGREFDYIFHHAAITDTTVEAQKMMRVNVDGFKNIRNLAKYEKCPIIYASSAGVYGNGPIPMKETQKLSPLNAYALSKVKADELAVSFGKDIKIIGLRYFNVYGKGEKHKNKSASMIWQLYNQMKNGKHPRIFKYGEQKRDFIYIKDIVDATIKAMEISRRDFPVPISNIVNIGTGISTTFNRIIEILNDAMDTSFEPEYFDNPYDFYQNQTEADTTLSFNLLGFKANFSIEQGIRDYFR